MIDKVNVIYTSIHLKEYSTNAVVLNLMLHPSMDTIFEINLFKLQEAKKN